MMKKLMAAVIGIMLIGLPPAAEAAGKAAKTQQAQDSGQVTEAGRSNVSQRQQETVGKREEARKKRDEKMKVRNRNVKKSTNSTANLFGTSKQP